MSIHRRKRRAHFVGNGQMCGGVLREIEANPILIPCRAARAHGKTSKIRRSEDPKEETTTKIRLSDGESLGQRRSAGASAPAGHLTAASAARRPAAGIRAARERQNKQHLIRELFVSLSLGLPRRAKRVAADATLQLRIFGSSTLPSASFGSTPRLSLTTETTSSHSHTAASAQQPCSARAAGWPRSSGPPDTSCRRDRYSRCRTATCPDAA